MVLAAKREGRTVFVEDESTFSLRPYTTYGWYVRGECAKVNLSNRPSDRFYAFGVSNGRKEHFRFFDGRTKHKKKSCIDSKKTIVFLRYLHSKYARLLIIWDAATPHKSKATQVFAAKNDIRLLEFPTAVPDENPEEQVWDTLKAATGSTYFENYAAFLGAVKRESRKKNLTKMFPYLSL